MSRTIKIILLLLLLAQTGLSGQNITEKAHQTDLYTYRIDRIKSIPDTLETRVDSIRVNAVFYFNRIIASCFFEQSQTVLTVSYYTRKDSLICVRIKEQSPVFYDMYRESFFYYEKGTLADERYRWAIRGCLPQPINKSVDEIYGYNPALVPGFLKNFVLILYGKLNTQIT